MDPVTAIGLASSILTFVDFSAKLIQGTYEAYKTGVTQESAHVHDVLDDLQSVTDSLQHACSSSAEGVDKALVKLALKCIELSAELESLLKKLTRSANQERPLWSSLRVGWMSLRKQKKVEDLEQQLDRCRSQILLRLSFLMFAKQSLLKTSLDDLQKQASELSNRNAKNFADNRESLQRLLDRTEERPDEEVQAEANTQVLTAIKQSLDSLQLNLETIPQENIVLGRLFFPAIHSREDAVQDPEGDTFSWIHDEEGSDGPDAALQVGPRVNEVTREVGAQREYRHKISAALHLFLKKNNGLYFICGKAGSGKSTLIKYLGASAPVQTMLGEWASGCHLVFVQVYFWASGNSLQRSHEGFYRTILFETLRQCPELIPTMFTTGWERWQGRSESDFPFRIKELVSAFKQLKSTAQFPKYRFCFFIDGLDEYEGDSLDHLELAENLKEWAEADNVKIVCTARPHTEFIDTFDHPGRTANLHNLNEGDIALYAQSKLRQALLKGPKWGAAVDQEWFVKSIVNMADGVFLWARLVVRSLLGGMAQYESAETLQERLKHTPKDLDVLFANILEQVDPVLERRSQQVLLIACNDTFDTSLNSLAYLWGEKLDNPGFPFQDDPKGLSAEAVDEANERVRHQLDVLTKGLLEMREVEREVDLPRFRTGHDDSIIQSMETVCKFRVEFFHRSARDYVKSRPTPRGLSPDFPTPDIYYRLRLAEAKALVNFDSYEVARQRQPYFYELRRDTFQWLALDRVVLPASHIQHYAEVCQAYSEGFLDEQTSELSPEAKFGLSILKAEWYGIIEDDDLRQWFDGEPVAEDDKLHFLFFALYWQQMEYVAHCIDQVQSLDALQTKELNLLVSAFLGMYSSCTKHLLGKGASPGDLVELHLVGPVGRNTHNEASSDHVGTATPLDAYASDGEGDSDSSGRSFTSHRVPHAHWPAELMDQRVTKSVWMVVLRLLGLWISTHNTEGHPIADLLEYFLSAGADPNVVFLVRKRVLIEKPPSYAIVNFKTVLSDVFYMEFQDLLELGGIKWHETTQRFLDRGGENSLWAVMAGLFSGASLQGARPASRVAAARSTHKYIGPKDLHGQYFEVYGVVSDSEDLIGEFALRTN